jgi:DNA polymerase I
VDETSDGKKESAPAVAPVMRNMVPIIIARKRNFNRMHFHKPTTYDNCHSLTSYNCAYIRRLEQFQFHVNVDISYHHFRTPSFITHIPITRASGDMDLHITDRIVLSPGRFYAIVAPIETMLAGLNDNPVIGRYTTVLIGGNFSRLLNGINRTSGNFEIRRAFTVHQLLTILREEYHSIVIVEHDPTLYEDAGEVKRVVPPTMKDVSHDSIFVLYAPKMDRHFAYLAHTADHIFCYDDSNDSINPDFTNKSMTKNRNNGLPNSQKTLF